jgi:hypothetical protein
MFYCYIIKYSCSLLTSANGFTALSGHNILSVRRDALSSKGLCAYAGLYDHLKLLALYDLCVMQIVQRRVSDVV